MNAEQIAMAICEHFEGKHFKAYKCPAGKWTTGIGHLIRFPQEAHLMKDITETQATALFNKDIANAVATVRALVKVPLNENQRGALISFVFNGCDLARSTLLKKLNAREFLAAANEFPRWNKADKNGDGKTTADESLPGLTRRRLCERSIFLGASIEDLKAHRWYQARL